MTRYVALMDRATTGAYGLVLPDLTGCVAMGHTVDEALASLADAMSDWIASMHSLGQAVAEPREVDEVLADPEVVEAISEGAVVMIVPFVSRSRYVVQANLTLDSGVLAAIDAAAEARRVSRSSMVELLATQALAQAI